MNPIESAEVELGDLTKLFYCNSELERELGQFRECKSEAMPAVYRQLLAHHHHMTVTVEQFHNSPIELQVLATKVVGDWYARKILLRRTTDGQGVLFGIVRIDLSVLDQDVRKEIESQQIPLGQILINHDVLRQVRLVGLYEIQPGHEVLNRLARFDPSITSAMSSEAVLSTERSLDRDAPTARIFYGRTAIIFCNHRPVIELLEIVAA